MNFSKILSNKFCGAARLLAAVVTAGLMMVPGSAMRAQTETGQIAGTVADASGAVVGAATVTLTSVTTNAVRSTASGGSGEYGFQSVPAGLYTLTAQGTGFQPYKRSIEVTVGGRVTLNVKLAVSGTVEVVTVEGEGGAAVNTQTQEVSQIINPQQVSQLPSLSRNPYDFVTIAGNISGGDKVTSSGATSSTGDQNDTTRGVGFSLNGQRSTGTEILLDGVENNDTYVTGPALTQIPIDSVQGVPRDHKQLRTGVRARLRRGREHHYQGWNKLAPRRGVGLQSALRVHRKYGDECAIRRRQG